MELVIDDESVAVFAQPEFVAEFDRGSGFAAFDDMNRIIIKTEDLVLVGDFPATDDALVGLLGGGGELFLYVLDAADDLRGLFFG